MKADGNDKIFYKQLIASQQRLESRIQARERVMQQTVLTANKYYWSEIESDIEELKETLSKLVDLVVSYSSTFEIE